MSYKDEAYDIIKDKIIKLEFYPGQKISKKDLVSLLNIGDTPVREAILQLKREGLLVVKPQSGTSVSKISMQQVQEAKFVRTNLELAVFLDAMERITDDQIRNVEQLLAIQEIHLNSKDQEKFFELDDEFHRYFYKITEKENVYNWLLDLTVHLNRYRHLTLEAKGINWKGIIEQHKAILNAVKNKDKKQLTDLITSHLGLVDQHYKFIINDFPDYFE